jgi:hypothetical protein
MNQSGGRPTSRSLQCWVSDTDNDTAFLGQHGGGGEHQGDRPATIPCGEDRPEQCDGHQQLGPSQETRHRLDVHGMGGEHERGGGGGSGRQPAPEYGE